ncbi:hypothetical protein RIB2604_01708840 [Aspergillus luchuensis]|uniref:Uncharacterized protein n=1 Tax=Aspergillus kawachii TaxID=1069201 RepID=A0A146FCX5_ASPKA|nr:hypothetical protein RIB2604_01708840 [Aspergillus luchuensis]
MKVTLTLKRPRSAEDIAYLHESLKAIHPEVTETSREGLKICFAAPTMDTEAFVDLFLSWLHSSSPDVIMEGVGAALTENNIVHSIVDGTQSKCSR